MPPKSKLGQNFLRDQAAIARIAASLGDVSGQTVVEIGPGEGAITQALMTRAAHLTAIELDHELALRLQVRFSAEALAGKFAVVEQDVLAFDFAAAAAEAGHKMPVAGNLPYYITSPILLKLAENHASLDRAVLMVQREVADRVTAEPGSRDYGVLSVTVQMYGPHKSSSRCLRRHFRHRQRCIPRSSDGVLRRASRNLAWTRRLFCTLPRMAFAQKRKTLANNLRAGGFGPEAIQAALAAAGIAPAARAEALAIEELAAVFTRLEAEEPA